ncbi:glycoside hydrolase N-terminal domain-containing protein [Lentisphaera profundi]|uniref:Glycoside hydrolase N-terminal domain-containing protein n=1 Tax=Lentisphaera profundi TaxID=1658616 RepID=A0ABY7VST2_9BACT|nr:glycoside hydrolase N-terminal domain-containing protein [Lentisphaera profundi]WDE97266.1 glycoside hydrolase N-terminal domain-containing protein [Lentisphaera profundi]
MNRFLLCFIVCFSSSLLRAESSPKEQQLWYKQPANNWQTTALPIGNGRLGAMIFGGVDRERLMLNEDSMWIGDEQDTGSYQAFGDLFVQMHPEQFSLNATCPSHGGDGGEGVSQAFNNNVKSKWCLEHNNKEVLALIKYMGKTSPLTSYTLTSANDIPSRDPKSWELEASKDGEEWITLDSQRDVAIWEKRYQAKTFSIKNNKSYNFYRLKFKSHNATHFQLAGIKFNVKGLGSAPISEYKRSLDISKAVHQLSYKYGETKYSREIFSSAPAGVIVLRLEADKKSAHTGYIQLTDKHEAKIIAKGDSLQARGNLFGYKYDERNETRRKTAQYQFHLDYESQVKVLHEGGEISVKDGKIHFNKCDKLTIIVAGGTNFLNRRDKGWKGDHPHQRLSQLIASASKTPYKELRRQHIENYQSLYNRFSLELKGSENSKLPTDKRLEAYAKDGSDKALEALLVQYARYLMISCSRPGSLPANLQGMWNDSNNPPWRSDYHSDVNVQMNYWFVDQCNISECFTPYADWIYSTRSVRIDKTKKKYGVRGWAARSENGIFGGSSYLWVPGDAAWLAQNLWDHYAYTKDKKYLREKAFPLIKDICLFWEDSLIKLPNGKLVSPKSVSPEHGPALRGNSYEQQLIYDLFTNYIEAAKDLGVDQKYSKKIASLRSQLLMPQIGRWGQLQEWMEDRDDPKNQHRHLSHLIAVYPGRQISPMKTPELAKAAAVSLNARGDSGTGWSIGWKISLWARLLDGNRAHSIIRNALKPCKTTRIVMNYAGGIYPNLLMAHPPFQIEANFGFAAGVCEMLMQSHLDSIILLPSLPDTWQAGEIRGVRARGDMTLDIKWTAGKLISAKIKAGKVPVNLPLIYQGKKIQLKLKAGERRQFSAANFQ